MSNGDKQHEMRRWIGQHVTACVSYLVSELAKDEKFMDDLWATWYLHYIHDLPIR